MSSACEPHCSKRLEGKPAVVRLCGEERVRDGNAVLVRRVMAQGGKVRWREFEGMPHLRFSLMWDTPNGRMCYEEWANFCGECVDKGQGLEGESVIVQVLAKRRVEIGAVEYKEAMRVMRKCSDASGTLSIKAKF